jgi:subtilisin family serine protease
MRKAMSQTEVFLEMAEVLADLWAPLSSWKDKTGRGVPVGVVDSGIDAEHPDLKGKVKSSFEVAQADGKCSLQPSTSGDAVGHGTACAGIIARVAPDAELHSVKITRGLNMNEAFLAGLDYAVKQKMRVINLSLGATTKEMYKPLHDILHRAYRSNCFIVAAASNLPSEPTYPSVFTSSLISVTKKESIDPLDFFFQEGSVYELGALGVGVQTAWPGGGYRQVTGNSFATPHVVGIIARMLEAHPDLQLFQVKTILYALAKKQAGSGKDEGGKPDSQA